MLNDRKILGLRQELLIRVDSWPEQLRCLGTHLAHLLGHLAGGFGRLAYSIALPTF